MEGEASSELNIAETGRVILVLILYMLPHKAGRSVQCPGRLLHPCRFCIFIVIHTHPHTHLCPVYAPTPNKASHLFLVFAGSNLIFLLLHTCRDRGVPGQTVL